MGREKPPFTVRRFRLIRLLALLLTWTAALALPLAAAPAARAMDSSAPCPMEAAGMAADHGQMDCCDHDKGGPDDKAPCKPGMACFATAAALPTAGVETLFVALGDADLFQAPTRAPASRPPDRNIRPPITL